ncbi:hypothetical protein PISMIDRAFT_11955 [Pisolithus microcarpus 441]|uniref:Uncharacterized protein n=1 Tax=Pisolithus microcarpus 441 TaxID=765257 RepID=A0A0C9ZQD2_9AGAM|nr:hypothetical protein PISMIDRAFT_11955 [Pisolithus microcarpus 441]
MLLRMWESGSTFWKLLNNEDYEALCHERNAKLNSGELVECTCRTRLDKGTKRTRQNLTTTRNSRHTFKSAATVPSDTEDEENGERDTSHVSAVAAHPEDRVTNPTAVPDTNTGKSSGTSIDTTSRLTPWLAARQTNHSSTAPHSAEQTGYSSTHYPDPPMTLRIPEINLDLTLRNLDQNYNTMWTQGDIGDTYRFDYEDGHGFDGGGRYGFGDQSGTSFGN